MYCDEICYMSYQPPSEKWHHFENIWLSNAKRFVCCTFTIRYIIYSMIGRSIASISDLGGIYIYLGALCLGKYGASGRISAIDLSTIRHILHMY